MNGVYVRKLASNKLHITAAALFLMVLPFLTAGLIL